MERKVYLTRFSSFFPGEPVFNDQMEERLGYVAGRASRSKAVVLRNNKITQRYYATDKDGKILYSNAALAAHAITGLWRKTPPYTPDPSEFPDLLACGTTWPDHLLPSHASMVHGELGWPPVEAISTGGSCLSSFGCLKYAFAHIRAGLINKAVVCGSELFSPSLRAEQFEEEARQLQALEQEPFLAFEKDFLRWMLSDGAAAAYLSNRPGESPSLEVEWMELISFAGELETCMFIGGMWDAQRKLHSYRAFSPREHAAHSMFAIQQNARLLSEHIVPYGGKVLRRLSEKYGLRPEDVDWFLPHLSSMFFADKIERELQKIGFPIPREKWFTNLTTKGNIGSAAVFSFLDEMHKNNLLKSGQHLLIMVPESARFSYGYAFFRVV
ncbi:MAG: StlD/DarB family beta-ketosynthase [Flavobacteriales bacterium]|nr:StlD/DarB family beta-ketosynthase [Flavobacteriales bacterium]